MLNNSIVEMTASDLDLVAGGNDCTQDIAAIAGGVAAVIGAVAAPFTFGASLAIAAAAGLVIGVHAASAQTSCD